MNMILKYGSAEIEVHEGSIQEDWNVMIHDDLLATGGTAIAAAELVKSQKANVGWFFFLIELSFLGGLNRLDQYSREITRLITF